jgi:hypothetical protein
MNMKDYTMSSGYTTSNVWGVGYLKGQTIPSFDPAIQEQLYCVGHFIYNELKAIEEYKEMLKKRLLAQGFKYLVSIIDPRDSEAYKECGASVDINYQGVTFAYMAIEGTGWRESARLFFYENYENMPDVEIVDNVISYVDIGEKKPLEVITNGKEYTKRRSKLKAIKTWATDNIDKLEW